MGTIYRAHDKLLDMEVAVKVLRPEMTRAPGAIQEFKQEARTTIQFSHPHIVRLFDLQQVGNHTMMIMEFVDGKSLWYVLNRQGPLATDTSIEIITICADALQYAHDRGVLHNDLKPDNILLTHDGVLKIIDFGTANLIHTELNEEYLIGTPAYMSPEQLRGEVLDERSDVYALGMITCELLTGTLPYSLNSSFNDFATATRKPMNIQPESLCLAVEKALFPDREQRWRSVTEYAQALNHAVSLHP